MFYSIWYFLPHVAGVFVHKRIFWRHIQKWISCNHLKRQKLILEISGDHAKRKRVFGLPAQSDGWLLSFSRYQGLFAEFSENTTNVDADCFCKRIKNYMFSKEQDTCVRIVSENDRKRSKFFSFISAVEFQRRSVYTYKHIAFEDHKLPMR